MIHRTVIDERGNSSRDAAKKAFSAWCVLRTCSPISPKCRAALGRGRLSPTSQAQNRRKMIETAETSALAKYPDNIGICLLVAVTTARMASS